MIFGVIVAGGVGSRLGADMPKQFLNLAGRPIIMHTLGTFLKCPELEQIYLGVHPEWMDYMAGLVERYVSGAELPRVHLVAGGAERNETIMNVIRQIEADFGENGPHYIITQDGVRPFVSRRLIADHIKAVVKYDAVDTAIPAVDTIVLSEDGKFISDIPERQNTYIKARRRKALNGFDQTALYGTHTGGEKYFNDACKICTVRRVPVHIVAGEASNMKITTAKSYQIAQIMAENWESDTKSS
ncbi:MAG: D-ribitol-5-phosphate cytidylyltransferase [Frisingicoccus sp.]